MMSGILEEHFYHKSITTIAGVFGTLFNNLKIKRSDGKEILVPIIHSSGQKYNERDENPDKIRYRRITPRLAFQLTGWERDTTRVKNKLFRIDNTHSIDSSVDQVKTQYNRVPYKFYFTLFSTAKYVDDLFQISEQILASFNSSVQVVVRDNPDLSSDSTFTVNLLSSQLNDNFEGTFDETRELTASFDFSLDGYLYMPTNDDSVIRTVYINYRDIAFNDLLLQDVVTEDNL